MSTVNELVITPEFVTNIIAVDLADETTFTTADKAKLNGIEAGAQVNAVTRVAGKTGAVDLNAGDIAYDASETYASGKIGAALKSAEEKLDALDAGDIGYDASTAYGSGTVGEKLTELNRQISEVKSDFDNLADATAIAELTGSYFDFSPYIGKPLFGRGCLFAGSGATFDIDISGLDLAGKQITTGLFVSEGTSPIEGYITESQLDTSGNQIYPTSGYHYVNHVMEILEGCTKIRLYCNPQGYTTYQNAILNHAQLYTTTAEQVDYTVSYKAIDHETVQENTAAINDIADKKITGSWIDFTNLQGNPLFGTNGLFSGSGTTRDFAVPTDAIGLTLSTYLWLSDYDSGYDTGYIYGNITEVQLDANGTQIYPTSGYHYIGHPMLILPECKTLRYFAAPNAYTLWNGKTITHIQFSKDGDAEYDYDYKYVIDTGNTWKGKKWVSYGDSTTARGTYQAPVVEKFELIHVNAGLGGSCVADNGDAGIASFTNQARIDALPSDAYIVTIMGGTNDFNSTNGGQGTPLGDLPTTSTFDTTTFKGALSQTVRLIQAQCPNAIIVILTNIGGRGSSGQAGTVPVRNAIGLTSADYAAAAIDVAKYFGLPYVDTHSAGINPFNRTLYIADSVHQSFAGAELISRPIKAYFEGNMPKE